MKKVDMQVIALALALTSSLTLPLLSVKAADKPPTLEYGIIRKNNNGPPSASTHPPPANNSTRGCNVKNFCRHFTLTVENTSGTRVEALGIIEVGASLNSSESGTEAITSGIAAWLLNKTNGNTSGRLSVSMDPKSDIDSAPTLQAAARGVGSLGLDVQYRNASMSTEDVASLLPVDGNITITDSNQLGLKFFTHVEGLRETDLIHILEYAKTKIQAIRN